MQIAIVGRQPKLSLAELESLFGPQAITPIGEYVALVDSEVPLPQPQLGGTIKSATVLTRLEKTNLQGAFTHLQMMVPEHILDLPEGKLQLGVSVYGHRAKRGWLLKQLLALKKTIKKAGRSVRIIENKAEDLESAQVLYNKLTGPLGMEFLLVADGIDTLIAQTTAVQNIDNYSNRDFDRPKRDAFIGMLPPKLAQIMINIAVGQIRSKGSPTSAQPSTTILDPFCGTGVVLQEALLMGFGAYGTDLSQKMIGYSQENLEWLTKNYSVPATHYLLTQADATTYTWDISDLPPSLFIVCETYLGKPLTALPAQNELHKVIAEANQIAAGFLKNVAPQLKKGTRLCVALPAWNLGTNHFMHLPVLDQIRDMGYNRLDFTHAKKSELVYHRPGQIVGRELTILEKL